MTWARPGPGRPPGTIKFAAWKGFLEPFEYWRIEEIERTLRGMGRAASKSIKYEYGTIRNRALKRMRRT